MVVRHQQTGNIALTTQSESHNLLRYYLIDSERIFAGWIKKQTRTTDFSSRITKSTKNRFKLRNHLQAIKGDWLSATRLFQGEQRLNHTRCTIYRNTRHVKCYHGTNTLKRVSKYFLIKRLVMILVSVSRALQLSKIYFFFPPSLFKQEVSSRLKSLLRERLAHGSGRTVRQHFKIQQQVHGRT